MKKALLIILVTLGLIAFFYPKKITIGCGGGCLPERIKRWDEEVAETYCIGIKNKTQFHDGEQIKCYGIFIER